MISNKKQDTKYLTKYAYPTDYIARNKKAINIPKKIWIMMIIYVKEIKIKIIGKNPNKLETELILIFKMYINNFGCLIKQLEI